MTRLALVPPNPNEFVIAWVIGRVAARCGSRFSSWWMIAMPAAWHHLNLPVPQRTTDPSTVDSAKKGSADLLILALVDEQALHGYEIARRIELRSGGTLTFTLAALYAITTYQTTPSSGWLRVTGILAGLAMGVKYTSFVLPLACGLLLLPRRPFNKAFTSAAQFSFIALCSALPWYVRNAILMGNPFYPFVLGGRYWDSFRADWYAGAGTGIVPCAAVTTPSPVVIGPQ